MPTVRDVLPILEAAPFSKRNTHRTHANTTASRSDDPSFRRRVGIYFQVLFFLQLGFMSCCRLVSAFDVVPPVTDAGHEVLTLTGVGLALVLGLGWQSARRGWLSIAVLQSVESMGTVMLAAVYVHTSMLSGDPAGSLHGLMLVAMALMLRASVIPSPIGRTMVVGVASAGAASLMSAHHGVADPMAHVGIGIMLAAFVAVTTVTSHVIYGLQREVSAARRLGQYELRRKLGQGGMGVVYEATHVLLKRPTAIKLLPIDELGQANVARFEREVQQTSRLQHPNSVKIYDYGRTPDGRFYYAMEYLDGLTLEELVESTGPLPPARAVRILAQAAAALAEAHAMKLVHRDVKPSNIMLCDRGGVADMVKVLDFGLVKELSQAVSETHENNIVGTPQFLAPEAIQEADAATPATDVYSLGAVAYFLLTGRHVFEASNVVTMCAKHLTETPLAPSTFAPAPLPAGLDHILLRCLAKDPADRFADGAALADALSGLDLAGWSASDARRWWMAHPLAACGDAPSGETRVVIDIRERVSA